MMPKKRCDKKRKKKNVIRQRYRATAAAVRATGIMLIKTTSTRAYRAVPAWCHRIPVRTGSVLLAPPLRPRRTSAAPRAPDAATRTRERQAKTSTQARARARVWGCSGKDSVARTRRERDTDALHTSTGSGTKSTPSVGTYAMKQSNAPAPRTRIHTYAPSATKKQLRVRSE